MPEEHWHFYLRSISTMRSDTCYKIGFIMKAHGLKGQVTLSLDLDAPENFAGIETLFVDVKEKLLPIFIEAISIKGNKAYLKLEGIETPEAAHQLSKSSVYLPKSSRPKSVRGEFYDDEIIGFEVVDSSSGSLGKITEIVQAGPNRLLSVLHEEKNVLIPLNGPFIDSVNKSKRKITVTLPEGFLEI